MASKRKNRVKKEEAILIRLVELFLVTGKPVGSNTLKKNGFDDISPATIRNYLAHLEKGGFLKQQHSSAGRIPTPTAFKLYASYHIESNNIDPKQWDLIKKELDKETREIGNYLQSASELLSHLTQGAVFLSSPRFDQDLIISIKIIGIDSRRYLAVIITDFGLVHSEILYGQKKLSRFSLKRVEAYFNFRLNGLDQPQLNKEEAEIALGFYNELMMRHIVQYANFSAQDIYKTGFAKLIHFPEFRDATILATNLSIFENTSYMRTLLAKCIKEQTLKVWIGDDLKHPSLQTSQSSVIAIPYFIHGKAVGAIALLRPIRMPYPKIFGILKCFSLTLSEVLTRNLYKYKITYRQPTIEQVALKPTPQKLIE